ncbi:MAG: hypothetical protein HY698_11190 [Deltaproteobacteria bacterium]|nr:hypothetical protein [Deltaproteobacteria bacterium]
MSDKSSISPLRGRSGPGSRTIDPELVALRHLRPAVGPVLAITVVGLSLYLIIQLRADLVFSLKPRAPLNLGDAAELHRNGRAFPDNEHVAFHAAPDHSLPMRLPDRLASGSRIVPVLGTAGRLWIHFEAEAHRARIAHNETHAGRLRALDKLGFAEELRAHVKSLQPVPRFVDVRKLFEPGPSFVDVHGDPIHPSAATPVEVQQRIDGVHLVTLYKTDRVKDESEARTLLVTAGLAPSSNAPLATKMSWTFEVPWVGPAQGIHASLAGVKYHGALVQPMVEHHRTTWQELIVDKEAGLLRVDQKAVPIASVERVSFRIRPTIPTDAAVLIEGQAPRGYWYVPVLLGIMALTSVLMIWSLVRSLRPVIRPFEGVDVGNPPPV